MILVVANCRDQVAKRLVGRWSAYNTCLMTPLDLSKSGWRYHVGDIDSSVAIAGGHEVAAKDIKGVLVRLPWIALEDLNHIISKDRSYVAAEMRAFLISWLTALKCPVINRPTPVSLLGPGWCSEKWAYTAAQLGIPVSASRKIAVTPNDPITLDLQSEDQPGDITVSVVGKRCFGAVNRIMAEHVLSLAGAAGVELIEARFGYENYFFKGVSLCPETVTDEVADALISYFQKNNIVPPVEVEA